MSFTSYLCSFKRSQIHFVIFGSFLFEWSFFVHVHVFRVVCIYSSFSSATPVVPDIISTVRSSPSTLTVTWESWYDGGSPQYFLIYQYNNILWNVVANVSDTNTSIHSAEVPPGTGGLHGVAVQACNIFGCSMPSKLGKGLYIFPRNYSKKVQACVVAIHKTVCNNFLQSLARMAMLCNHKKLNSIAIRASLCNKLLHIVSLLRTLSYQCLTKE